MERNCCHSTEVTSEEEEVTSVYLKYHCRVLEDKGQLVMFARYHKGAVGKSASFNELFIGVKGENFWLVAKPGEEQVFTILSGTYHILSDKRHKASFLPVCRFWNETLNYTWIFTFRYQQWFLTHHGRPARCHFGGGTEQNMRKKRKPPQPLQHSTWPFRTGTGMWHSGRNSRKGCVVNKNGQGLGEGRSNRRSFIASIFWTFQNILLKTSLWDNWGHAIQCSQCFLYLWLEGGIDGI